MKQGKYKAALMQRRMLLLTALLPAAIPLLKASVEAAGRLAWVCPLLALPLGLLFYKSMESTEDGWIAWERGQEGRAVTLICLPWGLVLLFFSADYYSRRLVLGFNGSGSRPLFLIVSLLLILFLGRSDAVLFRGAKLFFPIIALALAAGLLFALPAIQWENICVPDEGKVDFLGVLLGVGQLLSLVGYAVFVRFLQLPVPLERSAVGTKTSGKTGIFWIMGACGVLSLLLFTLIGSFGVGLTVRMDEPFLYLMGGAGLTSGIRRGEAVLTTLIAVGDLTLLAVLGRACGKAWEQLFPKAARWGFLPVAVALLGPLFLPEGQRFTRWEAVILPTGNLLVAALGLMAIYRHSEAGRKK